MDDSSQSAGSVIEDENGVNFHIPLALRKTPRAHAGINPFRMELCDNSSYKESSTGKKRTLSSGSSGSKESRSSTPQPPPLKKKRKAVGQNKDSYCWICHKDCSNLMSCEACPRVFHPRCVGYETAATHEWFCSECEKIVSSENVDTRSKAMKMLTIDQLCSLLRYALNRMKEQGDEAFLKPVSLEQFPNYIDFVFMPMDLSTLEKNIKKKMYGCTESFISDAKWILHNCVIFNGYHHKLTSSAKQIVKICKHEMNEIEACPDCYLHAYTKRNNWFCEPCREPHLLVWAKLKGFPFWPAKAIKVSNGNVDVRFFGAHDRAWIPVNQCFVLSKDIPTPLKNKKKGNFELSVEELELHIQKLKDLYGTFQYAPFRTTLEVDHINTYIHTMLPEAVFDLTPNATPFLPNKKPKLQVSPPNPQISSKESAKEESKKTNDGGRMTVIKQSAKEENPKPPLNLSSHDKGHSEVPSGVFESSKDLPSLDLQIPKLDLTKVPKPRLESIKKLESAIERLKDSTVDKTEEEAKEKPESKLQSYSQENLKDGTKKVEETGQNYLDPQNDSAVPPNNDLEALSTITSEGKLSISQSCEVTSTTNLTELTVVIPPPPSDLLDNQQPSSKSSTSSLNSPKKTNIYTQKLDQMIESCKAKLGIDEIREDLSSEESSDEESLPKHTVLNQNKSSKEENTAKENNDSGSSVKTQIGIPMTNKPGSEKLKSSKNKDASRNDDDEVERSNEDTAKNNSTQLRQLLQKPVINQNELSKPSKDNSASSEKEGGKKRSSAALKDHADIPVGRRSSEADVAESNTNSEGEETDEGTLIIDLERNDAPETVVAKENQNKMSTLFSNLRTLIDTNPSRLKSPPLTREKRVMKRSRVASRDDAGRKDARALPVLSPLGRRKSNSSYMYTNNQPLDLMCGTVEEMLKDAAKSGNLEASVKGLQLEIEKLQWRHQQELAEIKHNTDLVLLEMRASMDSEKQRSVAEVRRQCEIEKMKAIDETKKKQWCAHCGKEAIFYCCWNTSYCDYPCQQAHWPQHMSTCAQSQGGNDGEGQHSPPAPSNIIVTSGSGQAKSSESLSNQIQRAVSLQQGPSDTCTISPSLNKRQDSSRQGPKQAKNRESSWHKRAKEESNLNYLQQQERDKQRMHLQMQSQSSVISQASASVMSSQYSTSLGPSVQYIPSNAVQVIPQTSSLASPSALTSPSAMQVQYVANIPQNHPSISMGSTSGTMPHFTTMSSAPAFPLQQSAQHHQNHNILHHQQQQRSLQVSNSMYPIIIQSSAAALGLSENSSGGRAYHPRGPYIPGKPYHVS